jgi:hypothetical protein
MKNYVSVMMNLNLAHMGLVPAIHILRPHRRFAFDHAPPDTSGGAHAEPRGWPGIGPSEERPIFNGLYPAMTENGMIING